MMPTHWRLRLEDQARDARARVTRARERLGSGDGSSALQTAYQAVVAAATLHVWIAGHAWETTIPPASMPQRVQEQFPGLFSALATLDLADALTSPWTAEAAAPYVDEADEFVTQAAAALTRCLAD